MALIDDKRFTTQGEAYAFLKGLEYVNESSITIIGTQRSFHPDGDYVALFKDADIDDREA